MRAFDQRLDEIASLLRYAQYAVAFTGAGISTPSGIPDFRSPDCGLWTQVDPMAVASIYGFRQNPRAFYDWVHPLALRTLEAQPNAAHIALADLEKAGYLRCVITQNIDMLHTRAGSKVVYELHGHLREATCTHCFKIYGAEVILPHFLQTREIPHCHDCGGVIKPNVILFGEELPYAQLAAAREAARRADVMLIIGSSLEVAPASELPVLALRNSARLVTINLEPTPLDSSACIVIRENVADVLPAIVQRLEAIR